MKVGMNLLLWTDHPTAGHRGLLKQIKGWGVDGVEFPVIAMTAQDIEAGRKACDSLELGRTAILAYGAEQADPTSPDPALRKAALELIRESINKTRDLGAGILVGPFQQGIGRFTGAGPTEDERKRAAEVLQKAADHANSMHIKLAIEPLNRFEMYLTNTVDAAARLCRETGQPNVGILADTHHSNIEEEKPALAWAAVAADIAHVHISENHRGIPGSGHAVPAEIFRALRKSGYDEWLTIEAFGHKVPSLIRPLHLWRSFFEKEEDVAVQGLVYIRKGWEQAA